MKLDYNCLPVFAECDIAVIGSGPAGTAAAITAGRGGKNVILLDSCGCVGGISTAGMMSHWVGSVDCKLYDEVIEKSCKADNRKLNSDKKYINTETLKLVYLDMLSKADVRLFLRTTAVDVVMNENVIEGIVVANKNGLGIIKGKRFIDCTGDGDIAYRCGEDFCLGREEDGKMQPATLMFKVGGVRKHGAVYLGSFESTHKTWRGELQQLAKKHLPFPAGHVLLYKSPIKGVTVCNMTNVINIDGTNADDLNKAYFKCMEQIPDIIAFLRKYVRGYRHCYLLSTAELIGIRETRHIAGEYVLSKENVYNARSFDDRVVKDAYFNFDVHNVDGAGLDKTGMQKKYVQKKGYDIPYRSLLPKKTENLILAGRCISGTHMAHSNYRAMPICFAMGAAAGAACSISVSENTPLKELDVKSVQKEIKLF